MLMLPEGIDDLSEPLQAACPPKEGLCPGLPAAGGFFPGVTMNSVDVKPDIKIWLFLVFLKENGCWERLYI